jgi:hypothetical protein
MTAAHSLGLPTIVATSNLLGGPRQRGPITAHGRALPTCSPRRRSRSMTLLISADSFSEPGQRLTRSGSTRQLVTFGISPEVSGYTSEQSQVLLTGWKPSWPRSPASPSDRARSRFLPTATGTSVTGLKRETETTARTRRSGPTISHPGAQRWSAGSSPPPTGTPPKSRS